MTTQIAIQALTAAALTGLLLTSGLRLEAAMVLAALRQRNLMLRVLAVNFVAVPALVLGVVLLAGLPREIGVGMLILAAAPFAPVVPVFTKMARGDLALAAGLTAVFPLFSALLTPLVCAACLKALPGSGELNFYFLRLLLVLFATITLPLAAGLALRHWRPGLAARLLRPVEVISEGVGAVSLAFVTVVEFGPITGVGGPGLLIMGALCEVTMLLGYAAGGPAVSSRRVVALGTSNRNIALALLITAGNFAGTPIMGAVVANGLLLILLGLAHVAWWRWRPVPDA